LTNNDKLDLRAIAEKYTAHKFTCLAIGSDKKPVEKVMDKRGRLRTAQELNQWFGNGSTTTTAVAIIIHYSEFSLDTDGEIAEKLFLTKFYPRYSKNLQNALDTTTRTKSPNGKHRLFRINKEDFPTGIEDHPYWKGKGEHAEILLRGRDHYLIERGTVITGTNEEGRVLSSIYEEEIGIENCITLSKDLAEEFAKVSETVELELKVIQSVANTLKEFYVEPNRDILTFAVSGDLHKNGCVPKYLIHDLINCIIALVGGDKEADERHAVIERTCARDPDGGEVSGYGKLLEAVDNRGEVVAEIENQFSKLGYYTNNNGSNGNGYRHRNNSNEKSRKQLKAERNQKEIDYVDDLINEYHFKTLKDTDEIWYYDEKLGIYVAHADPLIKTRLELDFGHPDFEEDPLAEPLTIKKVNEYIAQIKRRSYFKREDFNPDISWIGTKNCMVNVVTGERQAFNHKFLNTSNIPVVCTYEKNDVIDFFRCIEYSVLPYWKWNSDCPKIMKFLHEVISDEDIEYVLDYLAYCLWREYKFHNFLVFDGAGLNGKSVLLTLVRLFLGYWNVSGETLDRLLNERFSGANLYQKLANVDADVSADVIMKNTGKLKELTGNDLYPGEKKYQTAFFFRNHAKLWLSCNKLPETKDMSDAFFRRLIIITFIHQFYGNEDDHDLEANLSTEEEFSGLLNELLWRLPLVLKRGIRPTTQESIAESADKYNQSSDPVKYFIDKCLLYIPGSNDTETKDLVYESYCNFCTAKKKTPSSRFMFNAAMTEKGFIEGRTTYKKGEPRPFVWKDIKVINWKEVEDANQTVFEFTEAQKEAGK
jgi:P4 family phage/plasmid primase-like protien